MNDNWQNRIVRNAWWLGGVAMIAAFNSLMIASSYFPRTFRITDGDEMFEILLIGNLALILVTVPSLLLIFLVLRGRSRWRRVRLLILGIAGAYFWGWHWFYDLQNEINSWGALFPLPVDSLLACGLPFLWSISLVFAALIGRCEAPRG